jgi:hypothetical protein
LSLSIALDTTGGRVPGLGGDNEAASTLPVGSLINLSLTAPVVHEDQTWRGPILIPHVKQEGGSAMYLEYFETTADDFLEHCHWDEANKQEMRKPVAPNGHCGFDAGKTGVVIDLAWFEDPRRPTEIPMWDDASRRKMRQPVLTNDTHRLDETSVCLLTEFGSLCSFEFIG